MENLNKLTASELQRILKEKVLRVHYQRKVDLINRLLEAGITINLVGNNNKSRNNSTSSSNTGDSEIVNDITDEVSGTVDVKAKGVEQDLDLVGSEGNKGEARQEGKGEVTMATETNTFTFRDIEQSLVAFNGESSKDVITWLKKFEQIATMCNWNAVQKYVFARRLLKGAARLVVESNNDCSTWDAVKAFLKSEFTPTTSSRDAHKALENKKKNSSESFLEYIYAMKQLATKGPIHEKSVVCYIISGISDSPANKSFLYEATTIEDLKKKIKAYEIMKEQISAKPSLKPPQKQGAKADTVKKQEQSCANCGAFSHPSTKCPHRSKGSRCFRCGEFGHVTATCSNPERPNSNAKKPSEVNLAQVPLVDIAIVDLKCKGLIDTGSDVTLLRKSTYERIKKGSLEEGPGYLARLRQKPITLQFDARHRW